MESWSNGVLRQLNPPFTTPPLHHSNSVPRRLHLPGQTRVGGSLPQRCGPKSATTLGHRPRVGCSTDQLNRPGTAVLPAILCCACNFHKMLPRRNRANHSLPDGCRSAVPAVHVKGDRNIIASLVDQLDVGFILGASHHASQSQKHDQQEYFPQMPSCFHNSRSLIEVMVFQRRLPGELFTNIRLLAARFTRIIYSVNRFFAVRLVIPPARLSLRPRPASLRTCWRCTRVNGFRPITGK